MAISTLSENYTNFKRKHLLKKSTVHNPTLLPPVLQHFTYSIIRRNKLTSPIAKSIIVSDAHNARNKVYIRFAEMTSNF